MDADFIAMGGGFAGISAGLRASELGLSAIVLEQSPAPDYLCNSRIAGGHLSICMDDPAAAPEMLSRRILETTEGAVGPELAKAYAEAAKPMLDWLRAHGVSFIRIGADPGRQWVMAPPRRGQPGLDWKGRGPDVALRRLTDAFIRSGGSLLLGARVVELVIEDGRCCGVVMEGPDAVQRTLRAAAVVIADGGFQGDLEAVRQFISRRPESLMQRNAGASQGRGLRMAEAAGAKLTGMDSFYGHPLARDAFTNDQLWPHPYLDPMTVTGIVVDSSGRRFVDEGRGAVFLANALAKREDPLDAFVVFDERIWTGPAADMSAPPCPNPTLKTGGAEIHVGRTVAEAAQRAGIAPAVLGETVLRYNEAVDAGVSDSLDPARSAHRFRPLALKTPPFYIIPMCAGLTYTMGGPAIDGDARVLTADDQPIPGLFAAGSAAGGLEGGASAGYIGGLCKALILGRRAAERAAADRGRLRTDPMLQESLGQL